MALPNKTHTLLAWATSGITGGPVWIGDFDRIGLSLATVAASVVTIQVNDYDGFTASLPDAGWSTATVLTANGPYNLEPGHRWLRGLQAASSSSATLLVTGVSSS